MHFFLQIRYLYKQTKIGRKKRKGYFQWNLLLSDGDMHLGWVGAVLICVLKSQINEHDKLIAGTGFTPSGQVALSDPLL